MDKDKKNQVPIVYNPPGSISLPLDENAFKEFMVSLLGQPESIEGYIEGAFEIDIGGFEHLNNLIDDRIARQNLSSLLEFKAKLFFNDGSSTSFNGVQSFISHRELRPLICKGFIFTWSYLVKFNDKQASERQEISISSVNEDDNTGSKRRKKSRLLNLELDISNKFPRISYSVRCTDKGWGIEITELIRRCLSNLIKTNYSLGNALRQKVLENFKMVEYSCWFLSFMIMTMLMSQFADTEMKECRSLSGKGSQFTKDNVLINEKIDFLIQILSACHSSSPSFFFFPIMQIVFVAIWMLLPILIYNLIKLPDYRFMLFTEASEKERDEYFRKTNDRKTFWIVTLLIGLMIGVGANYIYSWLTTFFR